MTSLRILPIPAFNDNYIWLLYDSQPGPCIIVDPGDAGPVFETLKRLKLYPAAILITHHHPDHTGGVSAITDQWPVPVYGPQHEAQSLISHPLTEADSVIVPELDAEFTILDIPGHTLGHIAFLLKTPLSIFCGDALFLSGCGRLFEGTPEQMLTSLNKIKALPDKTAICCGHEYTLSNLAFARTVEPDNQALKAYEQRVRTLRESQQPSVPGKLYDEKRFNPFLRTDEASIKLSVQNKTKEDCLNSLTTFTLLRKWKDRF